MPTKARYLADLLNASGELDSTGAIEAIQDQISSLFAAGSHTGISFSYNDSSGTFSATVGAEFIQDTVGAMLVPTLKLTLQQFTKIVMELSTLQ